MEKVFSLPLYLPMNGSRKERDQEWRAREEINDHLDFLHKQSFCLMLGDFFAKFPDVQNIVLEAKNQMFAGRNITVYIDGHHAKTELKTAEDFILNSTTYTDYSHLLNLQTKFVAKKEHLEDAWKEWMGEADWAKWNAYDLEGRLLQASPPKQNKRKPV